MDSFTSITHSILRSQFNSLQLHNGNSLATFNPFFEIEHHHRVSHSTALANQIYAITMNAIGLGLTGLFSIPFLKDLFPVADPSATTIKVAAGMTRSGEASYNTAGNYPSFALFDGNGNRIGFKRGQANDILGDGHVSDPIKINSIDSTNNRPAEYISISSGGSDALCIAYVYVTMANGDHWAVYGDIGYQCQHAWYLSNLLVGGQANIYYPKCVWIDSPKTPDGPNNFPQGMSIHIPDFLATEARNKQYQDLPDTMCKSTPRFTMWPKLHEMNCIPVFDPPLEYNDNSTDKDLKAIFTDGKVHCDPGPGKDVDAQQMEQLQRWTQGRFAHATYGVKRRSNLKRNNACMDHHVVITDIDSHSAKEVCESHTSVGPDFVSTKEGLYCDMCTHELWHVCSATIVKGCFDLTTKNMRPGGGLQGRDEASGRVVPDKSYEKTTHWN